MPAFRLTQRRVDALGPRHKVRDVRDAELKWYGVRVMPSGMKRYFIHTQNQGRRGWKIVGEAAALTEAQARARAKAMLAALRDCGELDAVDLGETPFEAVAEEVFTRYARLWKPGTVEVNRIYLRRQILPFFAGRPIGGIARRDVQAWFRSLHATPAAANRSAPILSVIMQQAEAWGYRPENSNPCKNIRRYRQRRSERFLSYSATICVRAKSQVNRRAALSPEEYRRLADVLERHEADRPLHVAAVRLLLLTGCRKSEILTLQWRLYREGNLHLPDSKTGPRTVPLSPPAVRVLAELPRPPGCIWVIPGQKPGTHLTNLDGPWWIVRERAELEEVRIHDCRHSFASRALALGESLPVIAKLLGHSQIQTTARYAHLARDSVKASAARVAASIAGDFLYGGGSAPERSSQR